MSSTTGSRHSDQADDFGIPALPAKPRLRGWIHAGTLPVAILLGLILIFIADGAAAKWSVGVFLGTSVLLFGVSALYHRFHWSERANALLRRLDHSNIFLLIAGTYTPMAVTALDPTSRNVILLIVWTGALIGIGFRMFWLSAPRWLYVLLYIGLGWTAVWFAADLVEANLAGVILVLVGGIAYTVGAVVYALKRPDPAPGTFGFHEVFHAFTALAFACHWTAMLLFVLDSA